MENFVLCLNTKSVDARVECLAKIAIQRGITVCDCNDNFSADKIDATKKVIYYIEPRASANLKTLSALPDGSYVFGYKKSLELVCSETVPCKNTNYQYVCLSSDEDFVKRNNYLTALAQKILLIKQFGKLEIEVLIIGHGKLAHALERVLVNSNLSVLNFNDDKIKELNEKYGKKAFYKNAPLEKFDAIINTIPAHMIFEDTLKKLQMNTKQEKSENAKIIKQKSRKEKAKKNIKSADSRPNKMPVIYELASPPYGFDFGSLDINDFDYRIEPGLPGRFYPHEAAEAVYDSMVHTIALNEALEKGSQNLDKKSNKNSYKNSNKNLDKNLDKNVDNDVSNNAENDISNNVDSNVDNNVSKNVGINVGNDLDNKTSNNVNNKVDNKVESSAESNNKVNNNSESIVKETKKPSIALCITGSPCSFEKFIPVLKGLANDYNLIPVFSASALSPNRFGDIETFKNQVQSICGNKSITTIAGSETLSSRTDVVASLVCPATGNTIAKLAHAITDTPVTMAVKALLRNNIPCVIGLSTNDALSGNAMNIGLLLNRRNYYFVPFAQDNPQKKPYSMIADFSKAGDTIKEAICGRQIQPLIFVSQK